MVEDVTEPAPFGRRLKSAYLDVDLMLRAHDSRKSSLSDFKYRI